MLRFWLEVDATEHFLEELADYFTKLRAEQQAPEQQQPVLTELERSSAVATLFKKMPPSALAIMGLIKSLQRHRGTVDFNAAVRDLAALDKGCMWALLGRSPDASSSFFKLVTELLRAGGTSVAELRRDAKGDLKAAMAAVERVCLAELDKAQRQDCPTAPRIMQLQEQLASELAAAQLVMTALQQLPGSKKAICSTMVNSGVNGERERPGTPPIGVPGLHRLLCDTLGRLDPARLAWRSKHNPLHAALIHWCLTTGIMRDARRQFSLLPSDGEFKEATLCVEQHLLAATTLERLKQHQFIRDNGLCKQLVFACVACKGGTGGGWVGGLVQPLSPLRPCLAPHPPSSPPVHEQCMYIWRGWKETSSTMTRGPLFCHPPYQASVSTGAATSAPPSACPTAGRPTARRAVSWAW